MNRSSTLGPIPLLERIVALDVLRGLALLGILLMNIQSFAMITAAYLNPTAYGNLEGVNLWVWSICHLFADQKFLSIFSLLFGAGILLLTQRAESEGRRAGWLHFRRMFWLLLFGLCHAYLVWHSDILVSYAVCAVVVYFFRKIRPFWLMVWGLLAVGVPSLIFLAAGGSITYWPPQTLAEMRADWCPTVQQVSSELGAYRGEWSGQMAHRLTTAIEFQTFIFLIWTGWRAGGLMLIGMAFLKWGILTAQRSTRFYTVLAVAGCTLGFPLIGLGVMRNFAANWSLNYSMFLGSQYNYWGSLLVAVAYVAMIMLIVRSGLLPWLQRGLAAVGRTALTNYLGQSLLCTLIFYGHGLGLFGQVERYQQLVIVIGIWAIEIAASILWLRRFQYGPMEWLWRSLTYLRLQPMLRSTDSTPTPDKKAPVSLVE